MLRCTKHGTEFMQSRCGFFGSPPNQVPIHHVACADANCTDLSGPLCRRCLPYYHVNLRPIAEEASERHADNDQLFYFECVHCGDQTWRDRYEIEEHESFKQRLPELARKLYPAESL